MAPRGPSWLPMAYRCSPRVCVGFRGLCIIGFPWPSVVSRGFPWSPIVQVWGSIGPKWSPIVSRSLQCRGPPWCPMASRGLPLSHVVLSGLLWYPVTDAWRSGSRLCSLTEYCSLWHPVPCVCGSGSRIHSLAVVFRSPHARPWLPVIRRCLCLGSQVRTS